MSKFYPSIDKISLRNYTLIENGLQIKRVKGDVFIGDTCVGYYNPIETSPNQELPYMFLRIKDEYKDLWEKYREYFSMFEYTATKDEETGELKQGLGILMNDLELLTLMYDFWSTFDSLEIPIGMINADNFKVVKLLRFNNQSNRKEIIDFIKDKIPQIHIDDNYPVVIFRCESDFVKQNIH